mmetsp:Transcript_69857/g.138225  ORF Transcript_69857/g.138225 Transcript_69857/m.138225 type:complete len:98 (+) Transcript_69857:54-347(+)
MALFFMLRVFFVAFLAVVAGSEPTVRQADEAALFQSVVSMSMGARRVGVERPNEEEEEDDSAVLFQSSQECTQHNLRLHDENETDDVSLLQMSADSS